jgi:glutamate racemase
VACNTATAAAIAALRAAHPTLPIVGVEPALKPAAARSRTGAVGVLATRSTLASDKFQTLLQAQNPQVRFVLQACDGLAAAIECADAPQIHALCARYTAALGPVGTAPGAIDTVVLGCTHYTFAAEVLQHLLGPNVELIDAGYPVAQRTANLLAQSRDPQLEPSNAGAEWLELWTTGDAQTLQDAAQRWLAGTGVARKVEIGLFIGGCRLTQCMRKPRSKPERHRIIRRDRRFEAAQKSVPRRPQSRHHAAARAVS